MKRILEQERPGFGRNPVEARNGVRYHDSVAQIIVRNLEEEVRDGLRALAAKHGRSMEAEVREILRNAVLQSSLAPEPRLGSLLAGRFRGIGLEQPIPELRGNPAQPADLDP